MKKHHWWILSGATVLVVVAALVAAAFGLLVYRRHQTEQWRLLAEEAYAQARWRDAVAHYSYYLPRMPSDLDALGKYAHANLQLVEGRTAALRNAAAAYHQMLRYIPDNVEAENRLVELYGKMQSWPTLEYYAREFLVRRPDDVYLMKALARALRGTGRNAEAIDVYQQLVDRGTTDSEVYETLAFLLKDRNDVPRARALLDEARDRLPEDPDLRLARARFFDEMGDRTAAQQELAEAVRLAPDSPSVLRARAEWAAEALDWAEARDLAEHALEQEPEDAGLYALAAQAYVRLGEIDRAVDLIANTPLLFRAENPELWITLADLQIALGRFEEAQRTVAEYVQSYPEQKPIADYLHARELLAKGDPEAAAEIFAAVTKLRPGFLSAQFYLAVAHLASGKETLGRSTLESYLSRNPGDERAKLLLAQTGSSDMSVEQIADQARQMIERGADMPDVLIQTAFSLFRAALASDSLGTHIESVAALFERAIKLRPQSAPAYQGLAQVFVAARDFDSARRVLDRAAQADIERNPLLMSRANLALAEGDLDAAEGYVQEYLTAGNLTSANTVGWSNLFVRWGHADSAVNLLTRAIERSRDNDRLPIEIERVSAAVRAGRLQEATAWVGALPGGRELSGPDLRSLDRVRGEVAVALLQQDTSKGIQEAERLLAAMRGSGLADLRADIVEGHLLLAQGAPDLDRAKRLFRNALKEDPDDGDAHAGMAHCALLEGDTARAAAHLARASGSAAGTEGLRIRLARSYVDLGRHGEANRLLNGLTSARSLEPEVIELRARIAIALGDLDQAVQSVGQFESEFGNDPAKQNTATALRAALLTAQGRTEEAIASVRSVIEANPDDVRLAEELSHALAAAGRAEEAAQVLREFAAAHSSKVEGWMTLARFQLRQATAASIDDAMAALSRALLLDGDYVPAARLLVEALLGRGDSHQAVILCERWLARDPDDAGMLYAQARGLLRLPERTEDALAAVNRAIEIAPNAEHRYLRGVVHLARRDFAAARTDFEAVARTMDRTPADLDLRLAWTYVRTGRVDLAAPLFEAAVNKAAAGEAIDEALRQALENELRRGR